MLKYRAGLVAATAAALAVAGGVAYALPEPPFSQGMTSQFVRIAPSGAIESSGAPVQESASGQPGNLATEVSVQSSAATPEMVAAAQSNPEGCETGEYQQEVEAALAAIGGFGNTFVDGRQSGVDCTTIKAFQSRFGVSPANGRAGSLTVNVARRILATINPEELAKCGADAAGITACVDLTQQTVWAVRDGAVVFGPTVTRTGMPGYATPSGTYHVYDRSVRGWSKPYQVWLPYWQNFNGGIGFHETTTYLHAMSSGSHGCVNLLKSDAVALYNLTALGTTVRVFGRRPGT